LLHKQLDVSATYFFCRKSGAKAFNVCSKTLFITPILIWAFRYTDLERSVNV